MTKKCEVEILSDECKKTPAFRLGDELLCTKLIATFNNNI